MAFNLTFGFFLRATAWNQDIDPSESGTFYRMCEVDVLIWVILIKVAVILFAIAVRRR